MTVHDLSDTRPLVPLPRNKLILSMTILYLLFASDLWARVGINALLPVLQKDLQLTDIQIGMLGSAVLMGMISFVLPASYLADRWSRRGTVCLMGLTWSLGTILCGLVPSMGMLLLGRFLVGGGNSSYAPASVSMLTNWFPKKSWGKVIGLYNTSYQIGISGGLIVTGHLAALYGWRMTFIIIGIPSLILALTSLCIPGTPKQAVAARAEASRKVSVREALRVILGNRTLMATALATTFFNIMATSFIMFSSIYFMREMNMDVAGAASILGLMGLTGFAAMPLGGYLLDAWYRHDMRCRGWFPAICLLAAALLFCLAYSWKSLPLMTIGCFVLNMVPTCYHVITQEVVPARYKASSYGSLVIFLQLGGSIGSTLTGVLSHAYGIQQALVWIQAALVLSALCFLAAGFAYRHDFFRAQER
ncbi:MFS transporter [uncultured Desulfovibrio sp.]|uniref:MFS transporter n=1 Tax=uncultured Desulfovibrio sp. TaxID=167968 RepID=UPI0026176F1A|nr:MFS transporter [uncultured Desulfovibrio sp.]